MIYKSMWIVSLIFNLFACSASKIETDLNSSQVKKNETFIETVGVEDTFAILKFDSASYQLGTILKGEIKETEIWFTNLGTIPLVIEQMTSCECTTLDYSRKPILPGARSKIKIKYDSKDKSGPQIIDIDILANTKSGTASMKLHILVK
ncbi:MAG: DUF1573 domain-containing protein [Saprospiraceae bacterium]|nr:DUF1573 domain-containing protein [Saprospiraceae bacterium]MBK9631022.1 DUF1573 domain-containing protein [Saprospiraceae bacterium]